METTNNAQQSQQRAIKIFESKFVKGIKVYDSVEHQVREGLHRNCRDNSELKILFTSNDIVETCPITRKACNCAVTNLGFSSTVEY